jgi:hypothetical protein
MKVAVTGRGGSGSWQVRGVQLGQALGATVKPLATADDLRGADLAIVVKRTPEPVLRALRESGTRWVYDIVDCYPQPESAAWGRAEAISWVQGRLRDLKPNAVIWPNATMRSDCDTGLPGMVLPHHCRPGIARNAVREQIRTVGYEGRPSYLAHWEPMLHAECTRRGWRFVVNPPALADVDVVVAFRGGAWDGYVPRHWKSAVKLANAHGSGTPFIGQRESGYAETATGAEYWADSQRELATAFDWLESQSAREQVSDRFVQAAYTVDAAAKDLRAFLETL